MGVNGMSGSGKLFVGIVVLIIAVWLIGQIFTATIGYVILAAVAFTIIALVVALVRASLRANADPKVAPHDEADKVTERLLRAVKRKMDRAIKRKRDAERLKH